MTTTDVDISAQAEELAGRIFGQVLGSLEIYTIYLGLRLGLYQGLADGPRTAGELAGKADIHPRYAREWLEGQAVAGLVAVDDAALPEDTRRYALPPATREVLLEPDSLFTMGPLVLLASGASVALPRLTPVYRAGGGLTFADYGDDVREGQAGQNRPMFLRQLAAEWVPAMPDVDARLRADPPARVADVACGCGWSSIGLAKGYPKIHVDGFDLDEASIAEARTNASAAGVDDRVTFHVRDVTTATEAHIYDLTCVFEALHDFSRPVEALRATRSMRAPGGAVLIMDERTAETFTAPGDDLERFLYAASVLHCLPVGMADQPSAATGTLLRPAMMRRHALDAGFSEVETLPIENDFFRFYRLRG